MWPTHKEQADLVMTQRRVTSEQRHTAEKHANRYDARDE